MLRPTIDADLELDLLVEAAHRQEKPTRYVNRVVGDAVESDKRAREQAKSETTDAAATEPAVQPPADEAEAPPESLVTRRGVRQLR